ncbi:MAG: tagaturonate epimerase family protein, partial [Desulforhopalus sp.]
MDIAKYSIGTGDRFGLQGSAQLAAVEMAKNRGVDLAIVWNKSYREHRIVKTTPQAVRDEADQAVKERGWRGQYFVDADHINLDNVDLFIANSDFFTIDVADFIEKKTDDGSMAEFVRKYSHLTGELSISGMEKPLRVSEGLLQ